MVSCVVLADGSVTDVRVLRSLDRTNGLDDAAVSAVKEWRFAPGQKDGVPVPVIVTVDQAFDLPGVEPLSTWPDGFVISEDMATETANWSAEEIDAGALHLTLAHPRDWAVMPSARGHGAAVSSPDGRTVFAVAPAQPLSSPITLPARPTRLASVLSTLAAPLSPGPDEYPPIGQAKAGNRWWIWTEAEPSGAALASALPDVPVIATGRSISAHAWPFTTVEGDSELTVLCVTAAPAGATDAEAHRATAAAASTCAVMLTRLTIHEGTP